MASVLAPWRAAREADASENASRARSGTDGACAVLSGGSFARVEIVGTEKVVVPCEWFEPSSIKSLSSAVSAISSS